MVNIKNLLKDIAKSLAVGIITSLVITIVISLASFLFFGSDIVGILNSLRAALFVFGALLLFLASYILLFKKEMLINHKDDYKKTFAVLKFEFVLLLVAFAVLSVGIVVDYISYMI